MKKVLIEYNGQLVEMKVHETQALSPREKRIRKLQTNAATRLQGGNPKPPKPPRGERWGKSAKRKWARTKWLEKEGLITKS